MRNGGFDQEGFYEWTNRHMADLGAHWTRYSLLAAWELIEPALGDGYNWSAPGPNGAPDPVLNAVYAPSNDIHTVINIQPLSFGRGHPARSPFTYPAEYKAFVRALAERYDGDGYRDALTTSTIKIDYFQLANEMQDWFDRGLSAAQYAAAAEMTLDSLRAANPRAQLVLVAGFANSRGNSFPDFKRVIDACMARGVPFAAVDIHWWWWTDWQAEPYPSWQSNIIKKVRSYLDAKGLNNVQVWSMETASWAGAPDNNPAQTEAQQAEILVKRYVWGRANGLDKLFWNALEDWHNFQGRPDSAFNFMGLVDNGSSDPSRFNTTRPSYWAYKKLAETTDNLVATPAGTATGVHNDTDIFAYRYLRRADSQPIYVLWREGATAPVSMKVSSSLYSVTNLIPDRYGNFQRVEVAAQGGVLAFDLGGDPALVAPVAGKSSPQSRHRPGGRGKRRQVKSNIGLFPR